MSGEAAPIAEEGLRRYPEDRRLAETLASSLARTGQLERALGLARELAKAVKSWIIEAVALAKRENIQQTAWVSARYVDVEGPVPVVGEIVEPGPAPVVTTRRSVTPSPELEKLMDEAGALYLEQSGKPLIEREYGEIAARLGRIVRESGDPFLVLRARKLWSVIVDESRKRSAEVARRERQQRILTILRDIDSRYQRGPAQAPAEDPPVARGVLDRLASPSPFPPATHKLMSAGRAPQLLYCKQTGGREMIDLDGYIGQMVAVWGDFEPALERGVIVIDVRRIEPVTSGTRPATQPATRPASE